MCPICLGRVARYFFGPAGGVMVALLYVGCIIAFYLILKGAL